MPDSRLAAREAGPGPGVDLAAIADLARAIPTHPWFTRVGKPLGAAERTAAMVAGGTNPRALTTWADARAAARSPVLLAGYDRDAAEQRRLRDAAFAAGGRPEMLERLSAVVDAGLTPMIGGARDALVRAGIADDELAHVAAGAASEAAYRAALARAGGADEHRFVLAYRLFTAGRWPLGHADDGYLLF